MELLEHVSKKIILWYQKQPRILPWKQDKNPYHVWVSEIMLQQTRIEAVKKYYQKFMEELPTIQDLANVPEEELLKLWEGLGYYSRARNLKKAACQIQENYQGKMPTTYHELLKLCGIGEYTAGAIASICYQEKVPAVDGNVLRVVSRVLASNEDVLLPETKKKITNALLKIIPEEAGDFNEGIMELGEKICIPNGEPLCNICPLQQECLAFQKHLTDEIPVRIKKAKRKQEQMTVFILHYEKQIAIQKRPKQGLLANLYEFPNVNGSLEEHEIPEALKQWNISLENLYQKTHDKHIFTHVEWQMTVYHVTVKNKNKAFIWANETEFQEKYPLPTAFKKLLAIS